MPFQSISSFSPSLYIYIYIYIYIYRHRENSGWNCGQRTQKQEWQGFLRCAHPLVFVSAWIPPPPFRGREPVNNEPLQPQYILSEKLENISDTQSTARWTCVFFFFFFFFLSLLYLLYFIPNRFEWNTFRLVFSILFVERKNIHHSPFHSLWSSIYIYSVFTIISLYPSLSVNK